MPEVIDNPAMCRFELVIDGAVAFIIYRQEERHLVLTHTEVPEALSGRGVGSTLVRSVLDRLRADGVRVVPHCEFVTAYVKRHPEYRDVLADGGRAA